MGKILTTLKKVFIDSDEIENDEMSTESQLNIINSLSELSDNEKKELTSSLTNIDKKFVFEESKIKIENNSIKKNTQKVKVDSVKAVAEVEQKIKQFESEKMSKEIEKN